MRQAAGTAPYRTTWGSHHLCALHVVLPTSPALCQQLIEPRGGFMLCVYLHLPVNLSMMSTTHKGQGARSDGGVSIHPALTTVRGMIGVVN